MRVCVVGCRVLLGFLIVAGVLAVGCGPGPAEPTPTPPPEPATWTLGLCISTLDNPFFVSLQEGAEEAANRLGVTLIVRDAKDDTTTQNRQIQELIDQQVSALLINPVGGEAVVPAIEAANQAGIPVFTIDRSATGGTIVSHIASDNLAGGRMAGNYLAEILNEKGRVVELEGIAGTSAAQERGQAFNEAIAAYPNIGIVARQTANFDRAQAKAVFAQILAAQAEIDGVFAHNDEMILGAIEAAAEAGRSGITFIGFDAIDDAISALENGELTATIAQQPAEMGRLGVETAIKHLKGDPVAAFVPVDLALVTK